MKRILSPVFLMLVVIIACSRKTVATKEVVPAESSDATQAEPVKTAIESSEVAILAAGKTVYETKCARCHGLKPTELYTSDRWDGILKIMAPKAKLTDAETQQLTAFVKANAKK